VRWLVSGFFYETVAPLLCIGNTSFIAISTLTSEMNFYTVRVCVCVCLLVDFLGYDMTCVVFEGLSRAFHTEIDIKDGPADKPASLQVHSNLTGVPSLHRR